MHSQVTPQRIVKNADGTVTLYGRDKDGGEVVQTGDHVLMATGRKPNTANMGLEEVLSRGHAHHPCIVHFTCDCAFDWDPKCD